MPADRGSMDLSRQRSQASRAQSMHDVNTNDSLFRTQAPMDGSMPGGRGPHQIPRDAQSYTTELLRRCNSDTSLLRTQMPPDGPMPADRGSMDLSRQRSRASRAQSMHDVNTG